MRDVLCAFAKVRAWGRLFLGVALLLCVSCKKFERKHIPVERVAELGYPRCEGAKATAPEVLSRGDMRSGPNHVDQSIVERYTLEDRGCVTALLARQEWPMGTADLEILYDAKQRPLRIWKRMTLPGLKDPMQAADIRRYELRTDPVEIKRRNQDGTVELELLKGGRPQVVIGPGRGWLSVWIKKAQLAVGQKTRELAIDIRGLEKIEPVTLLRERDLEDASLGGKVQVYTFYGRETVFADAAGNVIGDLAGLRPSALLKTLAPRPIPLAAPLDPESSP